MCDLILYILTSSSTFLFWSSLSLLIFYFEIYFYSSHISHIRRDNKNVNFSSLWLLSYCCYMLQTVSWFDSLAAQRSVVLQFEVRKEKNVFFSFSRLLLMSYLSFALRNCILKECISNRTQLIYTQFDFSRISIFWFFFSHFNTPNSDLTCFARSCI